MNKTAMEFAFDLAAACDEELRVYRHSNTSRGVAADGESKRFVIEDYREGYGSGATAEEAALSFLRSRLTRLEERLVRHRHQLKNMEAERAQIPEAYPQFEDVVE